MRPTKVNPGEVYGPLKILARNPAPKNTNPTWQVECLLCGHQAIVSSGALAKSRYALGCAACVMEQAKKLAYIAGMRIGSLTLKTRATQAGARSSWYAVCDCGQVDVYRTRELHEIGGSGTTGCRICNPDVGSAKEPADALHFSYKDEMGLRMQHLYLHGLVPA